MKRILSRLFSTGAPAPAEGYLPGINESKFICNSAEQTLSRPELQNLVTKETKKQNLCQSINDALGTAMATDDTAGTLAFFNEQ
jgi:2-oxoisovalerate dehydrogenase E1 component beta subunit